MKKIFFFLLLLPTFLFAQFGSPTNQTTLYINQQVPLCGAVDSCLGLNGVTGDSTLVLTQKGTFVNIGPSSPLWLLSAPSLYPANSGSVSVDVNNFRSLGYNGDIVNSDTAVGGGAPFTGVRRLVDGAYMLNGVINLVPFGGADADTATSISGYLNTLTGQLYGLYVRKADSVIALRSEKEVSISADTTISITSTKGNLLLEASTQANIILQGNNITRISTIGNNGAGPVVSNFLFNTCSIDSNDFDSTSEFGYSIMWDNVHARHNTLHNGAQDWHIDGKELSNYTNNKTIGSSRRDVISMINHDDYINDVIIGNGGVTENIMLHGYCQVTNDSVIGDSINRKDEYFFGIGSGKSDCKLTTGQTENNLFFVNSSMSRAHNSRQNLVLINTGVFDMSSVDTAIANLTVIKGTLRYPDGSQGAGKVLTSDANGNASWQASSSVQDTYADSINQAAAIDTIIAYTPPSDGTYRVGGYLNITAITGTMVDLVVTYTDIHGTPQSQTMNSGTILGNFSDIVNFRAQAGTPIVVKTVITGVGSQTYDVGATIEYMNH